MKKGNKKAFTLIELLVTIAVLGVLVLLASPRFFGHIQNAELTKGIANAKSIEKASEIYYMDHGDWPRLTDEPYTSEEIESYSERIFDRTGHEVNLDPEGNYYDIDYDKLSDYVQVPDDKKNYILQNPVGKVYYMENLNEDGIARVNYSSTEKDDNPIPIENPDGSGDEIIPDGYEMAELEDFEFVPSSSAPNEYHGNRGYYRYVGYKEYVVIPHIIQDVELKDYYRMFEGSNSNVKGVASDNKNVADMSYMFYGSASTSIELKYLDTSSVTNMDRMFYNSQATTLDLSSFDTSSVTNMYGMFWNSQVTTFDLSSFDTSSLTVNNMSEMFLNSKATTGYARTEEDAGKFNNSKGKPSTLIFVVKGDLDKPQPPTNKPDGYVIAKQEDFQFVVNYSAPNSYNGTKGYYNYVGADDKIVIPHIIHGNEIKDYYNMFAGSSVKGVASDNKNVTNMSNMFDGSTSTSIELKHLDTSSVTNMYQMFYNSRATTLDLSSFDTSSVTNMYQMFWNSRATTLDLSSFDTSSVTDMGYMFRNSLATTLDLSSFDTSSVTNMLQMFLSSKATTGYARTEEDAGKFNTTRSKPEELTFVVKGNLDKPQPPTNKPDGYVIAKQEDFQFVVNYSAPNTYNGTKGYYKYVGTDDKIVIPHIIHGNEIKDYYYMFAGSNVKGVASDNKNVTDMRYMFDGSTSTSIELKYLDTSSVTNMYQMFRGSQATTLDLSSFDTSSVTNMSQMFWNSRATTLDLSSFDTSSATVANMSQMFLNSKATTGYARTEEDAGKFNNSKSKPSALTFIVN